MPSRCSLPPLRGRPRTTRNTDGAKLSARRRAVKRGESGERTRQRDPEDLADLVDGVLARMEREQLLGSLGSADEHDYLDAASARGGYGRWVASAAIVFLVFGAAWMSDLSNLFVTGLLFVWIFLAMIFD